jgi:hypothetical protein
MKATRKGAAWIIHKSDVEHYQNTYLDKRTTRHKKAM